jgi:hypothetical protein
MGKRSIPVYLLMGKYLIYWQVMSFGFKYLNHWGIIVGFVAGIYLSLPILYLLNKKMNQTRS